MQPPRLRKGEGKARGAGEPLGWASHIIGNDAHYPGWGNGELLLARQSPPNCDRMSWIERICGLLISNTLH